MTKCTKCGKIIKNQAVLSPTLDKTKRCLCTECAKEEYKMPLWIKLKYNAFLLKCKLEKMLK